MKLIIIFLAFIFSLTGFIANIPYDKELHPFMGYFVNLITFVFKHFFLSMLTIVLIFTAFYIIQIKQKTNENKYTASLIQSGYSILISSLLGYVFLFLIAVIQFNIFSYIINISPGILGVKININEVAKTLKTRPNPPEIIATDNNHFEELKAISLATSGKETFYGSFILPSVPNFLVWPTKKIASTILIDNTLIISDINKSDLEIISPVVGYLFIKDYFPTLYIKNNPKFFILTQEEYVSFRKKDYAKKIDNVKNQITTAKDNIASISASIQTGNITLLENEKLIKQIYENREKDYNKCLAIGKYENGKFIRSNTKEFCRNQVIEYDNNVRDINNANDALKISINDNENVLESYKFYEKLFETQVKFADSLKNNVPLELGFFDPKDTIRIVINTTNPHAIADYFETVVHEYIHYASYIENKSLSSSFFDEGLTEYFARMAIKNSLKISTNLGYPVYVKIIEEILNDIPETEIADIYFFKEQKELEKTLNRVYGDDFYKKYIVFFETLTVTSDPKQVLNLANTIMKRINGKLLTEEDLKSSLSNL